MNGAGSRASLEFTSGIVAATAVAGAVGLATGLVDLGDPTNDRLPFHSPALAALALLVMVGMPMGATFYFAHSGRPYAPEAAIVAGTLLVGWIVLQVLVLQVFSWWQPAMALAGAVVFLTGVLVRARSTPRP